MSKEIIDEVIAILDKEEYLVCGKYRKSQGIKDAIAKLHSLKSPEQPPSGEFTKKIRDRWLAEAPHTDSTLDYAICAILDLCQRLDTSEASLKTLETIKDDLLTACKALMKAPDTLPPDDEFDREKRDYRNRCMKRIDEARKLGRAAIAKAKKE